MQKAFTRRRGPVVDDEQLASLIQDYAAGSTCQELAEKYGFKQKASVWELLKRRGTDATAIGR
jgi:hypothetical protein